MNIHKKFPALNRRKCRNTCIQSRQEKQYSYKKVYCKISCFIDRRLPGLFNFLSYRKLTTEKEASQAKSLVNALDYLMELETISTVPEGTLRHLHFGKRIAKSGRMYKNTREVVSICWLVVRKKKQYLYSIKVWLFAGNQETEKEKKVSVSFQR